MHLGRTLVATTALAALVASSGCRSPYRADQGALVGGLGGAGLGAIVGHQLGHTGAGAVIGGLAGAATGAVVGNELDEIEARNRREIEYRLGRAPGPGAVSIEDVIEMSQKGVNEQVLVDHVRARGVTRVPGKDDLITLSQAGVSPRVIKAMQEPPAPRTVVQPASERVIIQEHYYDPWPCWGPHWHYHHRHRRPGYSVGFSYRG